MSERIDLTPFANAIRGRLFPVAIWSDSEFRDFVLLDILDRNTATEEADIKTHPRFVGAVAIDAEGKPHSALNEPLDAEAIEAVTTAYVRNVESSIRALAAITQIATA